MTSVGLRLAEQKTEAVLITSRKTVETIKSQPHIRYLGAMIDSRFSYQQGCNSRRGPVAADARYRRTQTEEETAGRVASNMRPHIHHSGLEPSIRDKSLSEDSSSSPPA